MTIEIGDRIKLRNTSSYDSSPSQINFVEPDGKYDGLVGTLIEGPFKEEATKDISIYKIRLDKGQLGPDEVIVRVTWSAMEFLEPGPDKELFEAQEKWRKILDE